MADEHTTPNRFLSLDGHEQRLRALLKARGLGYEPPDRREFFDSNTATWLDVVQSRARRLGVATTELFARDRAALEESDYPGEECFEPHEMEQYMAGSLSWERQAHVERCSGCAGLLAALQPCTEQVAELQQQIRETVAQAAAIESSRERKPRERTPIWNALAWSFVRDAAASTAPLAIAVPVLLVMGGTVPSWFQALGAVGQVGVACSGALLLARRRLARSAFWRSSGGALVGGVVAAAFVSIVLGRAWGLRREAQATGTWLAEARVAEFAVDSLRARLLDGQFPAARGDSSSPLQVTALSLRSDKAVYEASAAGLPGTMVAELRPGRGELYWQLVAGGAKRDLRARLLVGIVEESRSGTIVLADGQGVLHTLTTRTDQPLASVGDRAVVILDASGSNVSRVEIVSASGGASRHQP